MLLGLADRDKPVRSQRADVPALAGLHAAESVGPMHSSDFAFRTHHDKTHCTRVQCVLFFYIITRQEYLQEVIIIVILLALHLRQVLKLYPMISNKIGITLFFILLLFCQMIATKPLPHKVSRSSSCLSSSKTFLSENDIFIQKKKARLQTLKRQRKTVQKQASRAQKFPQDMDVDHQASHCQSTQQWRANLSEERKQEYAEENRMQHQTDRGTWSAETRQEHRNQNNIHQEQLRRERWALSSGKACFIGIGGAGVMCDFL